MRQFLLLFHFMGQEAEFFRVWYFAQGHMLNTEAEIWPRVSLMPQTKDNTPHCLPWCHLQLLSMFSQPHLALRYTSCIFLEASPSKHSLWQCRKGKVGDVFFFCIPFLSSHCLQIIAQGARILPDCTRGNFLIDPVPTITAMGQKMKELWNKWFGACVFWPGTGESV